jgi:hypothetical protein
LRAAQWRNRNRKGLALVVRAELVPVPQVQGPPPPVGSRQAWLRLRWRLPRLPLRRQAITTTPPRPRLRSNSAFSENPWPGAKDFSFLSVQKGYLAGFTLSP